eukprot:g2607.t1
MPFTPHTGTLKHKSNYQARFDKLTDGLIKDHRAYLAKEFDRRSDAMQLALLRKFEPMDPVHIAAVINDDIFWHGAWPEVQATKPEMPEVLRDLVEQVTRPLAVPQKREFVDMMKADGITVERLDRIARALEMMPEFVECGSSKGAQEVWLTVDAVMLDQSLCQRVQSIAAALDRTDKDCYLELLQRIKRAKHQGEVEEIVQEEERKLAEGHAQQGAAEEAVADKQDSSANDQLSFVADYQQQSAQAAAQAMRETSVQQWLEARGLANELGPALQKMGVGLADGASRLVEIDEGDLAVLQQSLASPQLEDFDRGMQQLRSTVLVASAEETDEKKAASGGTPIRPKAGDEQGTEVEAKAAAN